MHQGQAWIGGQQVSPAQWIPSGCPVNAGGLGTDTQEGDNLEARDALRTATLQSNPLYAWEDLCPPQQQRWTRFTQSPASPDPVRLLSVLYEIALKLMGPKSRIFPGVPPDRNQLGKILEKDSRVLVRRPKGPLSYAVWSPQAAAPWGVCRES